MQTLEGMKAIKSPPFTTEETAEVKDSITPQWASIKNKGAESVIFGSGKGHLGDHDQIVTFTGNVVTVRSHQG